MDCDPSVELEFTYTLETTKRPLVTVAHASGDRSEAGCLTLTKLYDWLATAPEDVPAVCARCFLRVCLTSGVSLFWHRPRLPPAGSPWRTRV